MRSVIVDDKTFSLNSFRSARTSQTMLTRELIDPNIDTNSTGSTSLAVKFSVAIKVERFELLVFSDENFLRHARGNDRTHFGSSATVGSKKSDIKLQPNLHLYADDDHSSDGISDISLQLEEAEFFESNPNVAAVTLEEEEEDGHPILSSTDFLTFGLPSGIILNLSVESMNLAYQGITDGGAAKITASIGHISVLGEDELHLLSVGAPRLRDPISDALGEIEIHPSREKFGNTTLDSLIIKSNQDAMKATMTKLKGGNSFLEIDIAKIIGSIELDSIQALRKFVADTVVLLPKPSVTRTEFDETRDYILKRLNKKKNPLLNKISFAFRLQGASIDVHNGTLKPVTGDGSADCNDQRPKLVFVVGLVECYSGRLVDHIASLSRQAEDERSRVSGAKSTVASVEIDQLVSAQGMKLLDICEVMDRQETPYSLHLVSLWDFFALLALGCLLTNNL